MANWADTNYVIEGPEEVLKKLYKALEHHETAEGSPSDWEGNVLKALGIEWEVFKVDQIGGTVKVEGHYLRGFIQDFSWGNDKHTTIKIYAEEAWGLTDFYKLLEKSFPEIKVYYIVEEPGGDIYATNDSEGKYFSDRYFVDTCINGDYESEYFETEEEVYKWLTQITKGKVKTKEDAENFNDGVSIGEDDFIYIHEFDVVQ